MCQDEILHNYTRELVCPFCGHEFTNSLEYSKSEEYLGLLTCGKCNKAFYGSRNISITYSTIKAEYGTCNHCKAENTVIEDFHSTIGDYEGLCIKCGDLERQRLAEEYVKKVKNETLGS